MQFWLELYQDERKNMDMAGIRDEITYNYPVNETEGPTFEEINEILQNMNGKRDIRNN